MFTKNIVKTLLITSTLIGIPAFAADNTCSAGAGVGAANTQVKIGNAKCSGEGFQRHGGFGKRLGLTYEQLLKISTMKDQYRLSSAGQRAETKVLSDQLKNVLTAPQLDKAQALSIQSKLNDVKDKLSNEKLQFRIDFMSVLTPEQKEIVRHKMLVSEVFGGEHMGHRGGQFGHRHFEHNRSEIRRA
jgi:Spy/CpxP family protein refolding chaperone